MMIIAGMVKGIALINSQAGEEVTVGVTQEEINRIVKIAKIIREMRGKE